MKRKKRTMKRKAAKKKVKSKVVKKKKTRRKTAKRPAKKAKKKGAMVVASRPKPAGETYQQYIARIRAERRRIELERQRLYRAETLKRAKAR